MLLSHLPTVISFDSFLAGLFKAKDEVDPVVEVAGHVITLQRFSHFPHKVLRA